MFRVKPFTAWASDTAASEATWDISPDEFGRTTDCATVSAGGMTSSSTSVLALAVGDGSLQEG